MSHRSLDALRVAATLTHSLPGLRARIRAADRVLLHVAAADPRRQPPPDDAPVVSPCRFRHAIAHAHEGRVVGRSSRPPGLLAHTDPAVDIGTPPGGALLAGGIHRLPLARRRLWSFATTLAAPTAHDLGADLVDAALPLEGLRTLGIRPDPATGVSLLYAETDPNPDRTDEIALVELLRCLLARWTAHELIGGTDPATTGARDATSSPHHRR